MPLTMNVRKYIALQMPLGLLQFKVLSFWFVTAQACCSKLMRKLLKGISNIDNFVDDIIIFTSTWEQQFQVLEQLLVRIMDGNLTVKHIKCFFGFYDLECLGHMVGDTIIKSSPEKVLAIEDAS